MNGLEKIAYRNIKGIFDWEVGGWYNCIQDGCEKYIPDTLAEAMDIIYNEAMTDKAEGGSYAIGRAPKEVHLAGRDFAMKVIDRLMATDGDAIEIASVKGW